MNGAENYLSLTRKPLRALSVLIALDNEQPLSQGELRFATGLRGGAFHSHLIDFVAQGYVIEFHLESCPGQYVYAITAKGRRACQWLRQYLEPPVIAL